jgi:hypothetical protein
MPSPWSAEGQPGAVTWKFRSPPPSTTHKSPLGLDKESSPAREPYPWLSSPQLATEPEYKYGSLLFIFIPLRTLTSRFILPPTSTVTPVVTPCCTPTTTSSNQIPESAYQHKREINPSLQQCHIAATPNKKSSYTPAIRPSPRRRLQRASLQQKDILHHR